MKKRTKKINFEFRLKGPKLSNNSILLISLLQEAHGPARERGGDRPCGEGFSAGLIFLCFVSFYQVFLNEL